MIKPTVGRVVWYHPHNVNNAAVAMHGDSERQVTHAAQIVHVWSDTMVNLVVFDSNGVPYSVTSALLLQDDNPCPAEGYAEWMPYQLGQAAKTEQAEVKLAGG